VRIKKNIRQNVPGLTFINMLQPITYNLDLAAADRITQPLARKDKDGQTLQPSQAESEARKAKEQVVYTGFSAQDVEKAAKSLNYDFSGVDAAKNSKDLYGLRYSDFVVPLVKAVQELSKQNDTLKQQIQKLQTMVELLSLNTNNKIQDVLSSASLEQNSPNPFNNTTTIGYALPQQYSSAQIIVTDKAGKLLKEMNVSGSGKGTLQIDASTLSSGTYQYSLIVNNNLVSTRQMVLSK
jgi:trimeric autotransporter adhesin